MTRQGSCAMRSAAVSSRPRTTTMTRGLVPWTIFAVFAAYLAAPVLGWRATSHDGFDLAAFGRLPVAIGARVRPIDSVARMGLLQIRGTVDVPLAESAGRFQLGGSRLSA